MDGSGQPSTNRRGRLLQNGGISQPSKTRTPDASPSPSAKSPDDGETDFPFPRSTQTLSVGWKDGDDKASSHGSTMHIELAECVETKTVTTTTTTKRSYPPLRVRQRPLSSLDSKEYPLALKATPPELADLSFKYEDQLMNLLEDDYTTHGREVCQPSSTVPAARIQYTNLPTDIITTNWRTYRHSSPPQRQGHLWRRAGIQQSGYRTIREPTTIKSK